jgi:hypothetical protein
MTQLNSVAPTAQRDIITANPMMGGMERPTAVHETAFSGIKYEPHELHTAKNDIIIIKSDTTALMVRITFMRKI